jgi:hypothetical protein
MEFNNLVVIFKMDNLLLYQLFLNIYLQKYIKKNLLKRLFSLYSLGKIKKNTFKFFDGQDDFQ